MGAQLSGSTHSQTDGRVRRANEREAPPHLSARTARANTATLTAVRMGIGWARRRIHPNGRKIELYVVGEYTKQQLRTIGRTALQQMSLCAKAASAPVGAGL